MMKEAYIKFFFFCCFNILIFTYIALEKASNNFFWISILLFFNSYLFYRAILLLLYKPFRDTGFRPFVSIIVPVYNDGKMIYRTLTSCLNVNYPKEKMEIICIDDGSTDGTYQEINRFCKEYPGSIKRIRFKQNIGKRYALARGFRLAEGEIVVTLDSDSIIDEGALVPLSAPFTDSRIGATTARIKVLNRNRNLLTRILAVRYAMAFDFYRSSQSTFKTVMVCSGVLSAYRKDVVISFLDKWQHQRFLGKECTYGDDRALTNFILKSGYDTVFQRDALAYTIVPRNLKNLFQMVTRWNKSFIRESLIFASFMFSGWRKSNRFLPIFDFFLTIISIPYQFIIPVALLFGVIFLSQVFVFKIIVIVSLMGLLYMAFYIRFESSSDFIFGAVYPFLHAFFLIWTFPWALITLRSSSWLTR